MKISELVNTKRLFPLISEKLYEPIVDGSTKSNSDNFAVKLLSSANGSLKFWQNYGWFNAGAKDKLVQVLKLHCEAITAETAGYVGRADFFWRELHSKVKNIDSDQDLWRELLEAENNIADSFTADGLKSRFINELFIDTHLAFYKSYFEQNEYLTSRAFIHSAYLRDFIPISHLPENELEDMLHPLIETEANLYINAGKWDKPIELYHFILEYLPDNKKYQNALAEAYCGKALSEISDKTGYYESNRDAQNLAKLTATAQKLCLKYQDNFYFFRSVGYLYYLLAVKLSNSGNISDALVAIEKSLVFFPYLKEAEDLREGLAVGMESLQKQFAELVAEFNRLGVKFEPDDKNLWNQSQIGFSKLNQYLQSDEPKQMRNAFYLAEARHFWNLADLPEPAEKRDEMAFLFAEGLNYVLSEKPADQEDVFQSWKCVTKQFPELAKLDHALVIKFITNFLFENEKFNPDGKVSSESSPFPKREVGQIKIFSGDPKYKGSEPFSYWLFSRQNPFVKVQFAAALILLILAGALYLREWRAVYTRDEAFRKITEAAQNRQYENLLDNAEVFLANRRLVGTDTREDQVKNYYNEAIVRFVMQKNNSQIDEATAARIDHYRSLIGSK